MILRETMDSDVKEGTGIVWEIVQHNSIVTEFKLIQADVSLHVPGNNLLLSTYICLIMNFDLLAGAKCVWKMWWKLII